MKIQIEPLLQIAEEAGRIIMSYYKSGGEISIKADKSPVTEADIKANILIESSLNKLYPDITVIAEESHTKTGVSAELLGNNPFFLIDPLDGTKSFIRGSGEFTVNIGLIIEKKPIYGVILSPVSGNLYFTRTDGKAYKKLASGNITQISTSKKLRSEPLKFVASHSHYDPRIDDYMKNFTVSEKMSGSSSIKFCMLAEGTADVYPRFGRTMEWDTAAGHAILNAAGGRVENINGSEFSYAKPSFENPDFIAFGNVN